MGEGMAGVGPKAGPARAIPEWAWIALLAALVLDVWWRGHTFGPTVLERSGWKLWPVVEGESEPLDCDEAAYGYIGRRVAEGAVLYRDLTENKPPLGYWLYAAAIAMGDPNEITVRVLPIPMVLATIALVWWLGLRLSGPGAGCVAAWAFVLLSTDPYLYGNGSNLEHAINLLSVASLAAMVQAWPGSRRSRAWLLLAGALVGGASLVKQVAALVGPVYAVALLLRRGGDERPRSAGARVLDVLALAAGFAAAWGAAVGVLVGQGAGAAAYEDIVRFGAAMATDTPAARNAPTFLVRWVTGNSDPRSGALPWPFGRTDWLVWWGAGSWPLWLAAPPGLVRLLARPTTGPRRLAAAWTLAAWVQVALPGLFWAHYYLLPTPGVALAVGVLAAEGLAAARTAARARRPGAAAGWAAVVVAVAAALLGTAVLQVRDYLLVPPEELTVRYKGGAQWVRLRQLGRELGKRSRLWGSPKLYVWGWQSPLYYYSGLDSPTRHFFANELLKAHASGPEPHPVVGPWLEEILRDLEADPPALVFTGDPPFPALRRFLTAGYRASSLVPEAPALWVERENFRAFERWNRPGLRGANPFGFRMPQRPPQSRVDQMPRRPPLPGQAPADEPRPATIAR